MALAWRVLKVDVRCMGFTWAIKVDMRCMEFAWESPRESVTCAWEISGALKGH